MSHYNLKHGLNYHGNLEDAKDDILIEIIGELEKENEWMDSIHDENKELKRRCVTLTKSIENAEKVFNEEMDNVLTKLEEINAL